MISAKQLPAFAIKSRMLRIAAAVFALLILIGCKQPLFTDRPEEEINEMMATLLNSDIDCEKTAGKEGTYSLLVGSANLASAVQALKELGYPRQSHTSMGEIFQKKGLMSSPAEERIRFIYALSQEVSGTIAAIDGVIAARVHIVLPENNPFAERVLPSSASVFVKYKPDFDVEGQAIKIKELVVNSIEGLEFKNVTVALFKAEGGRLENRSVNFVKVLGLQMSPDSAGVFRWLAALVVSVGLGGLCMLGRLAYQKKMPSLKKKTSALINVRKR